MNRAFWRPIRPEIASLGIKLSIKLNDQMYLTNSFGTHTYGQIVNLITIMTYLAN